MTLGRIGARRAFTLIEMLLVVAIIGVLASLTLPAIQEVVDRARVAKATGDIRAMQVELASLDSLPATLAAIGRADYRDPWGRPYVYLRLEIGSGPGGRGGGAIGAARKDRFLVPLNTDFDLYSLGKDGQSAAPLSAASSKDDVLRANNGGFIGKASTY